MIGNRLIYRPTQHGYLGQTSENAALITCLTWLILFTDFYLDFWR